jgi:hypothetical protein
MDFFMVGAIETARIFIPIWPFLERHRLVASGITGFGRASMSNFAPQAVSTLYHFEIAENRRGYWVAEDHDGLVGGVFRSRKAALRFALFEAAGDSARVRLLPAEGPLFPARSTGTISKRDRH